MSISTDALQGKGRPPLTRADVLERLQQAHATGTRLNLTNETLRGSDLSILDLGGADLGGADLGGANLIGANLIGANLNKANLNKADLIGAKLSRADLSGADLSGADLSGADLSGAKLYGANLNKADLIGVKLREANLNKADLGEANLLLADLSGADLREMDLNKVELSGAILQDVIVASNTSNRNTETITLQIRIEDEHFSSRHLAETIATFRSLLTKLWLLQQGRMEDFEHYTQERSRTLENEVPLSIRFSVNSPANIQFNFDWGPKSLVEALQQLVDTFLLWKQRRRRGELEIMQQELEIEQQRLEVEKQKVTLAQHMVEAMAPHLTGKQKGAAIKSVLQDIHAASEDATLEISLPRPQLPVPQVTITPDLSPPQEPAENG